MKKEAAARQSNAEADLVAARAAAQKNVDLLHQTAQAKVDAAKTLEEQQRLAGERAARKEVAARQDQTEENVKAAQEAVKTHAELLVKTANANADAAKANR